MAGLVLLVIPGCVTSEAVIVALPAVLRVAPLVKVRVPATNAAFAGKPAFTSLEVMATVSLVFTTFHMPSTALTMTLNGVPAVSGEGVPVLPVALPGAAVSPGTSNCSFTNAVALIVIPELVPALTALLLAAEAVTVCLLAVLSVSLTVCEPALNAALCG